jgi:hypothetical protein
MKPDYSKDNDYKPGLFDMAVAFFKSDKNVLCSLEQHMEHFPVYNQMAGYNS